MATLTDKAILELIVDASKGVATLEEFQNKFTEGFEGLVGKAEDLGEGITHLNDPLRAYASITEEAAVTTQQWAKAISLVDPQLGSLLLKVSNLSSGLIKKNAALLPVLKNIGLVGGVTAGAGLAVYQLAKAIDFAVDAYAAQNKALDYTAAQLRGLGFEEAADKIRAFLNHTREGEAILTNLANAQERANKIASDGLDAKFTEIEASVAQHLAWEKELEDLAKLDVSEKERNRLLLELGGRIREATAKTDEFGRVTFSATEAELVAVRAVEEHEKQLKLLAEASKLAAEAEEERSRALRESLEDITQIEAFTKLDEALADLTNTFDGLTKSGELTREQKVKLNAEAVRLKKGYEDLGETAPEVLKEILEGTFDLEGATKKLTDAVRGNRDDLEKRTAVLIAAGAELREVAKSGKLSAEASQEFATELVELVDDWEQFGEVAPPALKALLVLYPDVIGQTKKYREELKLAIDLNQELLDSIKETIRAKREASGIDATQDRQQTLEEEVRTLDELEIVQGLTLEQSERLFEARTELSKAERELGRAVRDTGLGFLEQERAQVEAELAAAEHEQQQLDLAERMREAGIEADGLSESLFDLAQSQEGANDASDAAAQAYAQAAEGANALTAAVEKNAPVTEAWITKMNAGLATTISLLKEAKQCAVDLGGGLDQV